MDRDEAYELLPPLHAVALRLDDAGATHAVIAEGVGISPQAVPAFLEVARGKLARILRGDAT